MFMFKKSLDIPSKAEALPGRPNPIRTASNHFVNGHPLKGPYPAGTETAIFGMGCFWGAERGLGGTGVSCPIGTGVKPAAAS
jgi:peptide-methionine (S)-S-oxide reductase